MSKRRIATNERTEHNLKCALEAAEEGFPVFPCKDGYKVGSDGKPDRAPYTKHGFKDATTDKEQIRKWWDRLPNAVPAIATGQRSGVVVIDVDRKNGKDGVVALQQLGFEALNQCAFTVQTPSNGVHIYFEYEAGMGCQHAHLPDGVEMKGEGGFVYAPGAKNALGEYSAPNCLSVERLLGFQSMPGVLTPKPKAKKADAAVTHESCSRSLEDITDPLFHIPADLPYPDWNTILMALHHVSSGTKEGLEIAQEWSSQDPRWDAREVRDKWRSYGKQTGEKVGRGTILHYAQEHGWNRITARDFMPIDDQFEEDEPLQSHLTFLTPEECAQQKPRGYVVKGMVAPGDVGCIVGAPGAGKSVFGPSLAFHVAQGANFFGHRVKQGKVFYVAAEDPHGMCGRVEALSKELGDTKDFLLNREVSDLLASDGRRGLSKDFVALEQEVIAQKPVLIVIDTLAMAFPGLEENSAEAMGRVVELARRLAKSGAAVLLIHHDTKEGGGLPRGHSLLNGALDVSICLKRKNDLVIGALSKNRNGPCDAKIAFHIKPVDLKIDEDGDKITAPIAVPTKYDALSMLSAKEQLLIDALEDLAEPGLPVSREALRDRLIDSPTLSSSDSEQSRKRAFSRLLKDMLEKVLIREIEGGLWPNRLCPSEFQNIEASDFSDDEYVDHPFLH